MGAPRNRGGGLCYCWRVRRLGTVLVLLSLASCRPEPTTVPDEPAPTGGEPAEVSGHAGGDQCVSLVEPQVADDAYTRGAAKLEEARDGEHYLAEPWGEAMGALEIAAQQGHRAAQSLYGRRMFENMFLADGPTPEQHDAYVQALGFVRIAGLRGDEEAQSYLPGLTATPDLEEPPFNALPKEWIDDAIVFADQWLACHGEAAKGRGEQ